MEGGAFPFFPKDPWFTRRHLVWGIGLLAFQAMLMLYLRSDGFPDRQRHLNPMSITLQLARAAGTSVIPLAVILCWLLADLISRQWKHAAGWLAVAAAIVLAVWIAKWILPPYVYAPLP